MKTLLTTLLATLFIFVSITFSENWEEALRDCDRLPIPEQKPMCVNIVNTLRGATPQAEAQADEAENNEPTEASIAEDTDNGDASNTSEIITTPVARPPNRLCTSTLSIVNVELLKKPTRIKLTIRNNSRRFQNLRGLTLRLSGEDGTLKHQRGFGSISITYQKRRGEAHADSHIVLFRYRKGLENHDRQPEEKRLLLYPVDYTETDIFTLMCGETEVSRYPEVVYASPQRHNRITTLWAKLKK